MGPLAPSLAGGAFPVAPSKPPLGSAHGLDDVGGIEPPPRAPLPAALDAEGERLGAILRERFGIDRLHAWQRDAIEALLRPPGRVLVVAPTGGGKSLCYQLPAVSLGGTALVLSPLISLMEDQVRGLEARGIRATFIASSLPWEENRRRMAALRAGEYSIVYAAPERLAHEGFLDALGASALSLVAVDEAHCIVQWGHDFRPDYLRIGEALERLRPPRIVACTATATPDAREEIIARLGLSPDRLTVVLRGFARPNLHLEVREVSGMRQAVETTDAALAHALGRPRSPRGAGIVYGATRKGVERIAEQLRSSGWRAEPYHAGLDAALRAELSAKFAARELPVVVATNAFGMGIDRPDVRVVVHVQPPASLEAYYQEVGRAGRDGAAASGLLLLAPSDIALRRRMCTTAADGGPASPADAARAWSQFRELLRYVDAATCRHDFILRYFGDEAESLGGCGHCDVCREVEGIEANDPDALERDADVVRRALAGVARAKGGAGMQAIASMLCGEASERVKRLRLDRLSTFGVLAGRSSGDVLAILRALLAAGWIDLTTSELPVPVVTRTGWRVMKGELPARVRLPAPRARAVGARRSSAVKERASVARAIRAGSDPRGKSGGACESAASRASTDDMPFDEALAALLEALRGHRARIAKEEGVPTYVVATNRTLGEIALLRPRSRTELAMVHGMGPARIDKYGDGFLEVVRTTS